MSPEDGGIITATGDLFPKVPGVDSSKGVALNAPPASVLADTTRFVTEAMASVTPGEHGTLVAIATKTGEVTNVNLAFAVKAGAHVEVVTWIGKTWGTPVAAAPLSVGGAGRWHF